jgi:hypothetical protein
MRDKNLHEKFGLKGITFDIKKFWEVAETLPDVKVNGKMVNESLFLYLRYDSEDNIKNAFSDISKTLNMTYNQAHYHVERAFRHMLHPYRTTKYLEEKNQKTSG